MVSFPSLYLAVQVDSFGLSMPYWDLEGPRLSSLGAAWAHCR